MENLKRIIKSEITLLVMLIVWLGLSIFVCCMASFNENKRKMRMQNERNLQCSEDRHDSLWKKHVFVELADIKQKDRICSNKLDSLNIAVSQALVELRKMNRTLKARKVK